MIGSRFIREARLRAGLTQAELARRLGTSQPVIARWEAGRRNPTLETVLRAVRACGFDLAVSLVTRDQDHERLILDTLERTPEDRLGAVLDLLEAERVLQTAQRSA